MQCSENLVHIALSNKIDIGMFINVHKIDIGMLINVHKMFIMFLKCSENRYWNVQKMFIMFMK